MRSLFEMADVDWELFTESLCQAALGWSDAGQARCWAAVVEGATNAEIAERLSISVDTVTRHLTHIYAKTGTRRRAEAVRYALERGMSGP